MLKMETSLGGLRESTLSNQYNCLESYLTLVIGVAHMEKVSLYFFEDLPVDLCR